jgi:hypothetical protein
MRILLVGAVIITVVAGLWWYLKARRKRKQFSPFVIPPGVTVESSRFLADEEVALYNLLQMAVQEHYLVFCQVPLWSFVTVEAAGKMRAHVLRQIALKRVDFVLVHPGSCRVERVVQIERESSDHHQADRRRVIVGARRSGDQADQVAAQEKPFAAGSDCSIGHHCGGMTRKLGGIP